MPWPSILGGAAGGTLKPKRFPYEQGYQFANYPKTDYTKAIPDAFTRYMEGIYGKGGRKGYVSSQVRGAMDATSPYFRQASTQTAAGLGRAGGLSGGAQASFLSNLSGQRANVAGQAASAAEADVSQIAARMQQLAQQEGFQLSRDEIQRFLANLQARGLEYDIWSGDEEAQREFIRDLLGGGIRAAGFAFGGGG